MRRTVSFLFSHDFKAAPLRSVPGHFADPKLQFQQQLKKALVPVTRPKVVTMLEEASETVEDAIALVSPCNVLPHVSRRANEDMHIREEAGDDDVFISEETTDSDFSTAAARRAAMPADAMQMVKDEYKAIRESEVKRRRKILFELTHPHPLDYQFEGKLLPPPPLNFGKLTPEAYVLGSKVMAEEHYSMVKKAKATDYFFEINDLYMEVVFVGMANAGKSSLINALLNQPVAKTSSTPNTTREISFYQAVTPEELHTYASGNPSKLVKLPAGGFQLTLVDVPGYGIQGMSSAWKDSAIEITDAYLGVRRSVNTVFLCINAHRGFSYKDRTYMKWMQNLHGVVYIILTQCDKVPHEHLCWMMKNIYSEITRSSKKNQKVYPFILPVSAHTGTNIDQLRALIVETSGLIPGDKLRDILEKRSKKHFADLMKQDRARMRSSGALPQLTDRGAASASPQSLQLAPSSDDGVGTAAAPETTKWEVPTFNLSDGEYNPADQIDYFDTPYRRQGFKAHSGLSTAKVEPFRGEEGEVPPGSEPQNQGFPASGGFPVDCDTLNRMEVLPEGPVHQHGRGPVSRYMDAIDSAKAARSQERKVQMRTLKKQAVHEKVSAKMDRARQGARLLVEKEQGVLVESVGGQELLSEKKERDIRLTRAMRKTLAASPSAPWSSPLANMTEFEKTQYVKSSGKINSNPREFFETVNQHYVRGSLKRMDPKLSDQTKAHIKDGMTKRISFGAQPRGMFKKYAQPEDTRKAKSGSNILGLN